MFTYFGSDGFKLYRFVKDKEPQELYHLKHDSLVNVSLSQKKHIAALLDKEKVTIVHLDTLSSFIIPVLDQARVVISPCGHIIFTYKPYKSVTGSVQGEPNVKIFSTGDGNLIKSYIHRHHEGWQPQWTMDCSVCVVRVDGQIHIYRDNRFDEKPVCCLSIAGTRQFFMSPSSLNPHVALYIPGSKGYPSFIRVYKWSTGTSDAITAKSFYHADSANVFWNDCGKDLLVLTSTKSSGESYYGEQALHFVTTRESFDNAVVALPRKGSIHEIAWRPSNSDKSSGSEVFLVCYGDPPPSVTVFGLNCEPLHDFGTAYCNRIIFNPQGNLLLLAGLGNFPGDTFVWDFKERVQLAKYKVSDISTISWFGDGEFLLMATTTPRLRVNNGFGVWHYGGRNVFFQRTPARATPKPATMGMPASTEHELYDVQVLLDPILPPAPVPKKYLTMDTSKTVAPKTYVPPALRNRSAIAKQSSAAMYMSAGPEGKQASRNLPVGMDPSILNTKKPTKCKKPKAAVAASGEANEDKTTSQVEPAISTSQPGVAPAKSAEVKKHITRIRQKLKQIEQLKADQAAGKQLDHNQLDKLATEGQLCAELARLSTSVE